eukprot:3731039-Prymnesium_polylepis.1
MCRSPCPGHQLGQIRTMREPLQGCVRRRAAGLRGRRMARHSGRFCTHQATQSRRCPRSGGCCRQYLQRVP